MPTKDDFNPDHRLPRFLAREPEQQSLGKAWDRAVISSHVLKASIWAAAATALSIAILSVVGNPVTLLADVTASIADVTASLAHKSALQPDTYQSMPTKFNLAPMFRLCRRRQRKCWPARKMLPPLNPPVRTRRKMVKACLGNSKRGRPRKMSRQRSGRYSPFKMPRHRLCKMPQH